MKFKINLSGKGGECYLFKIDEEQANYLSDNDLESDSMDISEVLGIDDIAESNLIITGPYAEHDSIYLTIDDENGNQIFNSEKQKNLLDTVFENSNWVGTDYDDTNYLAIEDYIKGNFYTAEIEADEFDIGKLSLVITTVAERLDIVSAIIYDGNKLEVEWGDYWPKGFYFHLNKVW